MSRIYGYALRIFYYDEKPSTICMVHLDIYLIQVIIQNLIELTLRMKLIYKGRNIKMHDLRIFLLIWIEFKSI